MTERITVPKTEFTSEDSASAQGSITNWVRKLKDGDKEAAQELWGRYFARLEAHAAARIRAYNVPNGAVVPEDVAASVFESIWRGANAGRFQNVKDRDELWWLLQSLTKRKVIDHLRYATAARRFNGQPNVSLADDNAGVSFHELMADEPTAEYLSIMDEELSRLLALLRDDKLRQIAVLKIEGYSNSETAIQLDISKATLSRKLDLIRSTWQQAFKDQGSDHGKS